MTTEILCIIEIPKDSSSGAFPTAHGVVPETLGPDGESPLDVLVAVSEPASPGWGVIAKPVAVLALSDQGEIDQKVLCVPCHDPNWQHVGGLEDLPDQLIEEVGNSFVARRRRAGHEVQLAGWSSRDGAEAAIHEARERFRQNHPHDEAASEP